MKTISRVYFKAQYKNYFANTIAEIDSVLAKRLRAQGYITVIEVVPVKKTTPVIAKEVIEETETATVKPVTERAAFVPRGRGRPRK